MSVQDLKWLWKISRIVSDQEIVGVDRLRFRETRILKRRLNYLVKGARLIGHLQPLIHPREGSPLQRAMKQRPELAGVVIWPYICVSWDTKTSLQRIDEHFRVIEAMGTMLDFSSDKALTLLNLVDVDTDLRVVLDQPKWLIREGLFVINLFLRDVRIYSLAFSFAFEDAKIVTFIGALQGVDSEGILENYKRLTKKLHGMRPRDFLIELFRIFCRCVGVSKLYAVNDAKHLHNSSYFGKTKSRKIFQNYNGIWTERGGVQGNEDFFVLSLETPVKNIDEISTNKRAMYRRRYELLESLEERMQITLKEIAASSETSNSHADYSAVANYGDRNMPKPRMNTGRVVVQVTDY